MLNLYWKNKMELDIRYVENELAKDGKVYWALEELFHEQRDYQAFKNEFLIDADLMRGNYSQLEGHFIQGEESLMIIRKTRVINGTISSADYTLVGNKEDLDRFYKKYLGESE